MILIRRRTSVRCRRELAFGRCGTKPRPPAAAQFQRSIQPAHSFRPCTAGRIDRHAVVVRDNATNQNQRVRLPLTNRAVRSCSDRRQNGVAALARWAGWRPPRRTPTPSPVARLHRPWGAITMAESIKATPTSMGDHSRLQIPNPKTPGHVIPGNRTVRKDPMHDENAVGQEPKQPERSDRSGWNPKPQRGARCRARRRTAWVVDLCHLNASAKRRAQPDSHHIQS